MPASRATEMSRWVRTRLSSLNRYILGIHISVDTISEDIFVKRRERGHSFSLNGLFIDLHEIPIF